MHEPSPHALVEEVLGHRFTDTSILDEALTHSSFADHRLKSNERMEFLGDAILGYVVCEYLFREFPELLEGDMTKIKSAVVSRRVCAKITKQLKLDGLLNLGKGMAGRPGVPASVAAAVLESLIAALYLDSGMDTARRFILEQLEPYIREAAASAHQQNFKSVLQQLAQKGLPGNPTYVVLDEKGPDHAKAFEVCIEIEDRRFGSAWANSKKQAEQKAALVALTELGLAEVDDDGNVHLADLDAPEQIARALTPPPIAGPSLADARADSPPHA